MSLQLPIGNDKIGVASIHGLSRRRPPTDTSISAQSSMQATGSTDADAVHVKLATVATTANVALSGLQNLDGQTGEEGQVVLVRSQTDATKNGLYEMKTGTWSRVIESVAITTMVRVLNGSTYEGAWMKLDGDAEPQLDVDDVVYSRLLTGSGTTNRLARWSNGKLADGLTIDDGIRVRINTSTTSGRLNVGESSAFGTALYVANTAIGSGSGTAIYGSAAMESGIGVQGVGTGVSGVGVQGGGPTGVYGVTTSGVGVKAVSTGTGAALTAERNVNSASAAVVSILQKHSSNTGTAVLITQSGSGHGLHLTGGLGRAAYIVRNESTPTVSVVEIIQQHASNDKDAIRVENLGTGSAATAGWFTANGGIGVFCESDGRESLYAFRSTNGLSTPTVMLWQQNTGDANPVVRIRQDGTGDILDLQDGGTTVLKVEDGGVANFLGVGLNFRTTTKSANYTLTKSDHVIFADTSAAAGGFTLTLPATPRAGQWYIIIDSGNNAATNGVTLGRNGNNINGVGANPAYATNNFRTLVFSDGTDWYTMQ